METLWGPCVMQAEPLHLQQSHRCSWCIIGPLGHHNPEAQTRGLLQKWALSQCQMLCLSLYSQGLCSCPKLWRGICPHLSWFLVGDSNPWPSFTEYGSLSSSFIFPWPPLLSLLSGCLHVVFLCVDPVPHFLLHLRTMVTGRDLGSP